MTESAIKTIISETLNDENFCISDIIIALKLTCSDTIDINTLVTKIYSLLPERTNKLDSIKQRTIAVSNTYQWDKARQSYITASLSGQCANLMGNISRMNCLIDKVTYGSMSTCPETYWTDYGHRFEQVIKHIYMEKTNNIIHDVGLIAHQKIGYMAASTDGIAVDSITGKLINIEIKSLSRDITGNIKKQYKHQMQHQMECIGLDISNFVEAKFIESETEFDSEINGRMIEWYNPINCKVEYTYENKETEVESASTSGLIFLREIYWKLDQYKCQTVKKDPKWLEQVIKGHYLFWKDICYYRSSDRIKEFDQILKDKDNRLIEKRKKKQTTTICMI